MSAFKFPANPSDGDIVVRGDLQAFYNAATNTWRVSQLDQVAGIPTAWSGWSAWSYR